MNTLSIVNEAEKVAVFLLKHFEQTEKVKEAIAAAQTVPQDGSQTAILAQQIIGILS